MNFLQYVRHFVRLTKNGVTLTEMSLAYRPFVTVHMKGTKLAVSVSTPDFPVSQVIDLTTYC